MEELIVLDLNELNNEALIMIGQSLGYECHWNGSFDTLNEYIDLIVKRLKDKTRQYLENMN